MRPTLLLCAPHPPALCALYAAHTLELNISFARRNHHPLALPPAVKRSRDEYEDMPPPPPCPPGQRSILPQNGQQQLVQLEQLEQQQQQEVAWPDLPPAPRLEQPPQDMAVSHASGSATPVPTEQEMQDMAVSHASGSTTPVPTEQEICHSIKQMFSISRFAPGCLIVSMIYIERLRRGNGADLLASTWQPTLLASLILAQKVWDDAAYRYQRHDYTQLNSALTSSALAQLERDFLKALDYNVGVKAAIYTDWYFKVCTLAQKNQLRMHPLDVREANSLEIRGNLFEARLSAQCEKAHSGPMSGAKEETPSPRSRAIIS